MRSEFISSIEQVPAAQWDAVVGSDYPFLAHRFLQAMEASGATNRDNGWQPQHWLLWEGDELLALLPCYLKFHSYGEYIFDRSWADAWHRAGGKYYPKLLSAIPYTPATGPRLCVRSAEQAATALARAADDLMALIDREGYSSAHILLSNERDARRWQGAGFSTRIGPQYHWFNYGYADFEDFLSRFSSRKRKVVRKERRLVSEQGLRCVRRLGSELEPADWQRFYDFYQITYAKRSGHGGYLSEAFFQQVGREMGDQIMLVQAFDGDELVAAALNFFDSEALYGRYWGCSREYDCLHFEACYYQGIEFCIERGLKRFDSGAQGEHKIARGFEPKRVFSNHFIANDEFRQAIDRFLREESQHVGAYLSEASEGLPFRQDLP